MIEIVNQRGHLIDKRGYDEDTLTLVSSSTEPAPGWQLNGHRGDCRCETCRPDIFRI